MATHFLFVRAIATRPPAPLPTETLAADLATLEAWANDPYVYHSAWGRAVFLTLIATARQLDGARAALAEDLDLRDTCVACEAALHPPEVDLEDGAPHCADCTPDDDQRAAWLDARRASAAKTGR